MYRFSMLLLLVSCSLFAVSQTIIKMQQEEGVSVIPCKINGLNLSFSFATAAADVKIGIAEANFMFNNRYLGAADVVSPANYSLSELTDGVIINLKEFEFAGLRLNNINAVVSRDLTVPVLLGQSAITKLGPLQFDFASNSVTILNGTGNYDYSGNSNARQVNGSNSNTPASVSGKPVQDASIPKDAPIDVYMTDFKKNILPHEIVVFRSQLNSREYQGITDLSGRFSTRLPAGDKYDIFILGFKDSTSLNVLEIPALEGKAYYKNPFRIDLQFLPARSFILDDCNFETGKADLEEESFAVIDELVAFLKRKEDVRIELGGHTDNVGSPVSNQKLSEARANTVRDYLLSKGIAPERVEAKGYGLSKPVESNKTAEGRAMNRRTEVTILDN